jgi:drug/metabolite transporter (DMT)-like permease
MWVFLAILAGALFTAESLAQRKFLRGKNDAWAFAFFYSLIGTIISFPVMLAAPELPHSLREWGIALFIGFLIVANNVLLFRATALLEVSFVGTLLKLRLVWVFVLGIVLLQDDFSWAKLAGTAAVILSGMMVAKHVRRPGSSSAVALVLTATIVNAAIIVVSSYLLESMNVASSTFFATFLPATVLNFVLMPNARTRVTTMFNEHRRNVAFVCTLGALSNFALNGALATGDAGSVVVLNEAVLIFVVFGEHLILREKEYLGVKLIGIPLAVSGAVLIQLG